MNLILNFTEIEVYDRIYDFNAVDYNWDSYFIDRILDTDAFIFYDILHSYIEIFIKKDNQLCLQISHLIINF